MAYSDYRDSRSKPYTIGVRWRGCLIHPTWAGTHNPTLDLVTLLQALMATTGWKREKTMHLIGCRGFHDFLLALIQIYDGIAPRCFELVVSEMGEERRQFPTWMIESALTRHTENSIAYRIEATGRVFVDSGDASESGNLVPLARGADVFICECSLPDGWTKEDHLTAGQSGGIAQAAGVKKLVTHLYPPSLEADVAHQAQTHFCGQFVRGVDGMRMEL